VQRLHPAPAAFVDDDELRAAYLMPDSSSWRDGRWVRANFVMSLDGAIIGPDGVSEHLGTEADRRVFSLARELSDVVLVGAGTLRAEDYRASRRPLAIVTRTMDLAPELRVFADRGPEHVRPMVMTTDRALRAAPEWLREEAVLVPCGADEVDLVRVLDHLTSLGLPKILCEGGPALLTDLLTADLIDEVLLTIAPRLVGGDAHLVYLPGGMHPPLRFSTAQVLEHDGTVLSRLLRS
jgi:riboflavin biosynthesis pyrimidine reductase